MRKHMVTRVRLVDEQTSGRATTGTPLGNHSSEPPLWVLAEVDATMAGSTIPPAPPPGQWGSYVGSNFALNKNPRLEHLTCFVPGLLALGQCSSSPFNTNLSNHYLCYPLHLLTVDSPPNAALIHRPSKRHQHCDG